MPRGLLREQRKRKPGRGQRFGEHEWRRAQTVARSEESGGRRCDGHRHVTGCLVEAERETSTLRPHEIDLHVHSHRPGETLVHAQQDVCRHDPGPRRRQDDERTDRDCRHPSGQQDASPAHAICQPPGGQVRDGLDHTEADQEGQDRGPAGDLEVVLRQLRERRALDAHDSADERVYQHEQSQLPPVGAQPEFDSL